MSAQLPRRSLQGPTQRPLQRPLQRGLFLPYALALSLLFLTALALGFALYAAFLQEMWWGFLATAAITLTLALLLLPLGSRHARPQRREAVFTVALLWLLFPLAWALPYIFEAKIPFTDAIFEAVSGFTTTGGTALADLSVLNRSLLLWRALSTWVGGVGIIVLFVAVLPTLGVAGRQLFLSEAPGTAQDRPTPRLRQTALAVLATYSSLTLLCALLYRAFGMDSFEAVAQALSTLSSGGFSTNADSFAGFHSPALEWIGGSFMLLSGINFALLYRALGGEVGRLLRDVELRTYLAVALVATLLLTLILSGRLGDVAALRQAYFQTASLLTGNGYAAADYTRWPVQAQAVLLLLMFSGASVGSASGGIKIARWLILFKHAAAEVRRAAHPRAVTPLRLGEKVISDEILRATTAFVFLYLLTFAVVGFLLALLGEDLVTAFSASIACLGNIGAGLSQVGPMSNFSEIPILGRWLLIFTMYAGRLELLTVFVLFHPHSWALLRRL